ncbi:ABC transporter ATP-binding protein [Carnobacteriaceae bacterium zg-C25]|nr:ABC transporter ATP-binding protein [Carnobacteriaceae bacterium zg-C25]
MIELKNITKTYKKHQAFCQHDHPVLKDVSLTLSFGECVGLIGESGSGKSTLSRILLGVEPYQSGEITIEGMPLKKWQKQHPGKMSVVFQDYNASMNPKLTIEQIIQEGLAVSGSSQSVSELLAQVELDDSFLNRYPHQLSGGQLQRVAIARVLALQPKIIVLDEAVSSLDVSVQVTILRLLKRLQNELQLTYLFISHDLQAVAYLCDRIAFLHHGTIVEQVKMSELLHSKQPYVREFLSAVKVLEVEDCTIPMHNEYYQTN